VFPLGSQPHALVVSESQPSWSELLSEHPILRLEILDDLPLLLVDPVGQGDKEKSERMENGSHERRVSNRAGGVIHVAAVTDPLRARADPVCRQVDRVTGHYEKDALWQRKKDYRIASKTSGHRGESRV
jgi:hypothetical protein